MANHRSPDRSRAELPGGTVTFLLTDIEGSTVLWEQAPEAMRAALARHDALLTTIVEQHGGQVLKARGEGDSLFCVFARATDAVAAAAALQAALHAETWSTPVPLRVRVALHTGEAERRAGDYYGPAVNRCARLRAAGHGGQTLLTQTTAELVRDQLPAGITLRDLGEHRLRDLIRPEHIMQLDGAGLPQPEGARFPPLRTFSAVPNNLPAQLTSFVGRARELAAVAELLARHRLVTLTGAGGTGKTRLALHVAADRLDAFPDGIWLVELAPLADPALVPVAVAGLLGLQEEPGRSLTVKIAETLRERRVLLLLDNCEHLIDACAVFAETVLRGSRGPRVLATSREALGIAGEHAFRVPSLGLPDANALAAGTSAGAVAALLEAEAVRLFCERAEAVQPAFRVTPETAAAVAGICRRLDGIPLAIELAAARVRVLPVEGVAARLDDRFRLLTGGARTALPRQQTLRALIDWSYDLLTEPERTLLRRLSVFAGGWTLAAAEQVCGFAPLEPFEVLDLLTRLADKSLAVVDDTSGERAGEPRYRLLETVRQYARDRLLETDEGGAARDRHVAWCVALAAALSAAGGATQVSHETLRRLDPELDNIRAALEWSLSGSDPSAALEIAGRLLGFWWARGLWSEGRSWTDQAIRRLPPESPSSVAQAWALTTRGVFEWLQSEFGTARVTLTRAVAVARDVADAAVLHEALTELGGFLRDAGDLANARGALEEVIQTAEQQGCLEAAGAAEWHLGCLALWEGRLDEAERRLRRSLAINRQKDNSTGLNHDLRALADLASARDDLARAARYLEDSVSAARKIGERHGMSHSMQNLGMARLALADLMGAEAALLDALQPSRDLGRLQGLFPILMGLAEVSRRQGDAAKGVAYLVEARRLLDPAETAAARPGGLLANPRFRASWVGMVAALATAAEPGTSAARVLGAANLASHIDPVGSLPTSLNWRIPRQAAESAARTLRERLGEAAFTAAFEAGHALPLDDALTEADRLLASLLGGDRPDAKTPEG